MGFRGLKKHLKRLNAPKHWLLSKMGGVFAPRPSTGPHKLRECVPLILILRNRLKYALTRRESMMIVMRRLIHVDNKVRTDLNFPAGFQDVIRIEKTDESFRLLYDIKGRFVLHRIPKAESEFKLLRVVRVGTTSKASGGRNPLLTGQQSVVPYIVTHDGRTIRYPDPLIKTHDTVKFDLKTGKITDFVKFDVGNTVMAIRGGNTGRVGTVVHREKHAGSHEIVYVRDKKHHEFATRLTNLFVLGRGDESLVSLPKLGGVAQSIMEERTARLQKKKKN